jgi:hypothetical protein
MHRPHITRRARIIVLVALAMLVAATAAYAATFRTVTLNLEGGYGNANISTHCGAVNHYTKYHRGHTIRMNGRVFPVPSGTTWKVKIKIKKCTFANGKWDFRTVWTKHYSGNTNGYFYPNYFAGKRGKYFARAYYYYTTTSSYRSANQNFWVTR